MQREKRGSIPTMQIIALLVFTCSFVTCLRPWQGAPNPRNGATQQDVRSSSKCLNTVQGRWYVADDQGVVCQRTDLNSRSGCCIHGKRHSCETCTLEDQCCSNYEHCVSCCLRPDFKATNLYKIRNRSAGRSETGYWKTPFEYCRGQCRPNSNTTVHENAFLSENHFCFSENGKPLTPGPTRENLPPWVTVLSTETGQSCTQACTGRNLYCSEEHLRLLNNCNWLRNFFGCEAGCEPQSGSTQGFDQPSYMVPAAIKKDNPSMCLLNSGGGLTFSCEGKRQNAQRLCTCVSVQ
eukprot:TRINITY_DN60801_c0_g1_i1.p1 TRINITY_DN60801_c0_g1~~TRINITY_DN60801_c0_g1_i1.p1  ORF type:complete len:304 (+),score=7.74 TRINITY_DN60801_c0_g1_i1:36-914(+)